MKETLRTKRQPIVCQFANRHMKETLRKKQRFSTALCQLVNCPLERYAMLPYTVKNAIIGHTKTKHFYASII